MEEMKVRLRAHRATYIHNDIGNAAFYFKERVNERAANDDREGLGLEIMAGLTLLAFAVEARVNFLGAKLIPSWKERARTMEKLKELCGHLGVSPDFSARPYLSVVRLKGFRDTLAHGKPEEIEFDEEIVATAEELEAKGILHADWESYLDLDLFNEAYDDIEHIWRDLLAKSGLSIIDTLTHGGRQTTFIEHVGG